MCIRDSITMVLLGYWNFAVSGYSLKEIIGKPWDEYLPWIAWAIYLCENGILDSKYDIPDYLRWWEMFILNNSFYWKREIDTRKKLPLSLGVCQESGFRRWVWIGIQVCLLWILWSLMGVSGFGFGARDKKNSVDYDWGMPSTCLCIHCCGRSLVAWNWHCSILQSLQ